MSPTICHVERIARQVGAGLAVLLAMALTGPANAIIIDPVFEKTFDDAPVGAKTSVERAIAFWEATVTNPGTIPIEFGWDDVGGQPLPPRTLLGYTSPPAAVALHTLHYTESLLRNAAVMQPENAPLASAVAHLPKKYPNPGEVSLFVLPDAQYVALTGKPSPIGNLFYGEIGFDSDPPGGWDFSGGKPGPRTYDLTAVAESEIAHVLGRADDATFSGNKSGAPDFLTILDFYKYKCGKTKLDPKLQKTCFSIDGGNTDLRLGTAGVFNHTADSSSWQNVGRCGGGDLFDTCYDPGMEPVFSSVDRIEMEALGWDIPVPEPGTLALLGAAVAGLAALRRRRTPGGT